MPYLRGFADRNIKITKQSGKYINPLRDSSRRASLPGKRISKTGKVYYETRRNRSDALNSRI